MQSGGQGLEEGTLGSAKQFVVRPLRTPKRPDSVSFRLDSIPLCDARATHVSTKGGTFYDTLAIKGCSRAQIGLAGLVCAAGRQRVTAVPRREEVSFWRHPLARLLSPPSRRGMVAAIGRRLAFTSMQIDRLEVSHEQVSSFVTNVRCMQCFRLRCRRCRNCSRR